MKKIGASALWLLAVLSASAQPDTAFTAHLRGNGLFDECSGYLSRFPATEQVQHQFALLHLAQSNETAFLNSYQRSRLCQQDTALVAAADRLFTKQANDENRSEWLLVRGDGTKPTILLEAMRAARAPKLHANADFGAAGKSFAKFSASARRKPAVAAALSVVLPGLGKWYAGKPGSALSTFVLCAAYGLQAWESERRLGRAHPLTIVNLAFFAGFYSSGIYGSYHAVREQQQHNKIQFLNDAAHYLH